MEELEGVEDHQPCESRLKQGPCRRAPDVSNDLSQDELAFSQREGVPPVIEPIEVQRQRPQGLCIVRVLEVGGRDWSAWRWALAAPGKDAVVRVFREGRDEYHLLPQARVAFQLQDPETYC